MGIRWTKSQRNRLSKAVSKYNAKLTRELKKNPELKDYLPPRKSVASLKEAIKSVSDLKQEEKKIERLFKKGALEPITTAKGIKTTAYEIDEIKRLTDKVNRKRAKRLKEIPKNPEYLGILDTIERNEQRPKVFNPDVLTESGWDKFVKMIEFQGSDEYLERKQELYKANYIKAVENEYGEMATRWGFRQFLETLSPEQLAKGFYSTNKLSIEFVYHSGDQFERMMNVWNQWEQALGKAYPKGYEPKWKLVEIVDENTGEMISGYVDQETGEFYDYTYDEDDIFKSDWGK